MFTAEYDERLRDVNVMEKMFMGSRNTRQTTLWGM